MEDRVKTPHAFHEGDQLILKGEPIHPKALYDQLQRDFPKGPTDPNW